MHKPFIKVGFIGLLVIILSLVLFVVFPSQVSSMLDGFFTPIIAFEFVRTKQDVYLLFGSVDSVMRQAMIDHMDLGNTIDFIYMFLYSSFLCLFSMRCAKITGTKYYFIGAGLSFPVLGADALENIQLFGITSKMITGDFDTELMLLHYFTWMKWGGIVVIFMVLIPYFIKGNIFARIIALVGVSSLIFGILAFLNRSILNEIFALFVGLMFLLMIIYCFTYKQKF